MSLSKIYKQEGYVMKKRVLALLGACLLAVSAVTGCSNGAGTGTSGQSTTEAPEAG